MAFYLGIPFLGLLLTYALAVSRSLLSAGPSPLHDEVVAGLPDEEIVALRGLRRVSPGCFRIAENWLDEPPVLGRWLGPFSWLFIGFALMAIVNSTLLFWERDARLIPSMMAKTLAIGLIPLAVWYGKNVMAEWLISLLHFVERSPAEVLQWFDQQVQRVFLSGSNVACGILLGLLIMASEHQDGAFGQGTVLSLVVVVIASVVMTSLGGFALTVLVRGTCMVSEVGRFPLYVSASPYGVLSTGTMLVKIFGFATVAYVVALLTMLLRTGQRPTWPILFWALSVAVVYLVMFFLPQWKIHHSMVRYKSQRLLQTERLLKERVTEFYRDLSKNTHDIVEALRKDRDEIHSLPEWPFDWKNVVGIIGLTLSSAFSSAFPVVFKALLPVLTAWLKLPQ
jgi:hypothetical protein